MRAPISQTIFRIKLSVIALSLAILSLAGCARETNSNTGDPQVRVSRLETAGPLASLFGFYQIFEVGDSPVSGTCGRSRLSPTDPAASRFSDPLTQQTVMADEIALETGRAATGNCVVQTVHIFRGVGSWKETSEGSRYEFFGKMRRAGVIEPFSTVVIIREVGGPRLLRVKIQSSNVNGSYLIFKR